VRAVPGGSAGAGLRPPGAAGTRGHRCRSGWESRLIVLAGRALRYTGPLPLPAAGASGSTQRDWCEYGAGSRAAAATPRRVPQTRPPLDGARCVRPVVRSGSDGATARTVSTRIPATWRCGQARAGPAGDPTKQGTAAWDTSRTRASLMLFPESHDDIDTRRWVNTTSCAVDVVFRAQDSRIGVCDLYPDGYAVGRVGRGGIWRCTSGVEGLELPSGRCGDSDRPAGEQVKMRGS